MSDEVEVTVETNGDESSSEVAPDNHAEVMSALGDLAERVGRLEAAQDRESEAVAEEAAEEAQEAAEEAQEAAEDAVVAAVVTESVAEETAEEAAEEAAEEVIAEAAEEGAAAIEEGTDFESQVNPPDVEARDWQEPEDETPLVQHFLFKPLGRRR